MDNTMLCDRKRIQSIDMLRGLCIFFMVLQFWIGVFGSTFESWAPLFEHGDDGIQILPGIAWADIFAPTFMFIVGMTMKRSLISKEKKLGNEKATSSMLVRYLGLLGVGAVLCGLDKFIGAVEDFSDNGGIKFSNLNSGIFAISFFIALFILIVLAVCRLCKCAKGADFMGNALKYFLAAVGLVQIYSIFAFTGDQIFTFFNYNGKIQTPAWTFGTKIWDTLQNIGLAGLIALPVIKTRKETKVVIVGLVYIAMTAFFNHSSMKLVSIVLEGGIFGAPVWATIILMGSVFYEVYENKYEKTFWILEAVLVAFAVIGTVVFKFPAAKRGCSPVYAAFTTAIAALAFKVFTLFENKKPCPFLGALGGNALVIYVINFTLSLICTFFVESAEFEPSKFVGVLLIAVVMTVFALVVMALQKQDKHIRL